MLKGFYLISIFISFDLYGQNNLEKFKEDSALEANCKKHIGKHLANFNFLTPDSSYISNNRLKGKVVLLNFWTRSCTPCLAEFAVFNNLFDKFKDNPDFDFISLTYESDSIVNLFKRRFQISYKVLSVKWPLLNPLLIDGSYPTNIIIDRNGIIKYMCHGGYFDSENAKRYIMNNVCSIIHRELVTDK